MQFAMPTGMTPPTGTIPYNIQFQPQYQGMYAPTHNQPQSGLGGAAAGMANQFYQTQSYMNQPQQAGSPFFMQPGQYAGSQMLQGNVSAGQYGARGFAIDGRPATHFRGAEYLSGPSSGGDPGRSASIGK
jgi:hypothetical protein